ncbi:MAG: site-specific DNA-methyltransferase [Aestuariivita sp.]|nr:site-specific DNA-methyltransferase [Aestuariivita sp.]
MQRVTQKDGESADLIGDNVEHMKQLFPEAFNENGVDFDVLRQLLGDESVLDEGEEKYGLNWHGKKKARQIALTPSMGTLLPCPEESVDWDTTQNLFIEGDNLEVLKLLQKSYANKVKLIYIDPPYNTGKEFVYPDNYRDNLDTYLKYTGQKGAEGLKLTSNTETGGRKHTNWLNMMYPRLKLAQQMLSNKGVILISIDDNEYVNLKKICDEIFGEENYRNTILTRRRVKSLNAQFAADGLYSLNVGFEYVLVYAKSRQFLMNALRMQKQNVPTKGSWNVFWSGADRPTMRYPLLDFRPQTGQWRWSQEKALVAVANYKKYRRDFSNSMSLNDYWRRTGEELKFIRRIKNGTGKNGGVQYWIPPSETALRTSNWTDIEVSQIRKDFDLPFENPKSVDLVVELIKLLNSDHCIVMDFFAGSSTTAHAVMKLNAIDGSNRSYISVQLPEITDEKSEAFKAGYSTIAEISKERIRRAAKKIQEENPEYNGDLGFKVFKLAQSSIRVWNPGRDNLEETLLSHQEHVLEGRTEQDLLYELLLKRGVDLTVPIETRQIVGKTVYSIGAGVLFACLCPAMDIDNVEPLAEGILAWRKELDPEADTHVFFRDSAFNNDNVAKTNMAAILEQNGITHVRSL